MEAPRKRGNGYVGFRRIPGYPDYFVNRNGDVWSVPRRSRINKRVGGIFLRHVTHGIAIGGGSVEVNLFNEHGCSAISVSGLVMDAFGPPRPEGMVIRHVDGDFRNNQLSNLRWMSKSDVSCDARRRGNMRQRTEAERERAREYSRERYWANRESEIARAARYRERMRREQSNGSTEEAR